MARGSQAGKVKLWEHRLQSFQEQTLSVPQFCNNEGISTSSFYRWKRWFRKNKQKQINDQDPQKQKQAEQAPFKTVQLIHDEKTTPEAPLRIQLPTGIQIQVDDNQAVIQTVLREIIAQPGDGRC